MSTDQWITPQSLFEKLNKEFHFYLDAASLPGNAKCKRYLTPKENSLVCPWGPNEGYQSSVWLNPPYGKDIGLWMAKAFKESGSGIRIVSLIPCRTNAPWWHDYVMHAREIRFIKHKVSFEGSTIGVPFFGSAIAVFGPGITISSPFISTYIQPPKKTR